MINKKALTIYLYDRKTLNFKMIEFTKHSKKQIENEDGSVGRHTAPPRTTGTDRKSNGKEVRHQGNKKINVHPDR